jgi:uracil-DNA glycosylase family 4
MNVGFFDPTQWMRQRTPLPQVPLCGSCGLHKECNSPFMKHSGRGKRKVLILAEAPGAEEDRRGVQLVGPSGMEMGRLLEKLGVDMRRDCWITNAVVCRPHEGERNLTPTDKQVGYCRPNLTTTLEEVKPNVVLVLGKVALKAIIPLAWKEGEVKEVGRWVGWQIPSQKLNCWICPTYHPSYLLRQNDPVLEVLMLRHLKTAMSISSTPWKEYPGWDRFVTVEMDHHRAAECVRTLASYHEPLAFDYETTCLKPDGKGAEILCCSVSNGKISVAFPWYGEAVRAMRVLLKDRKVPKISANLRFEERWTRKVFGFGVRNWHWDTVLGAHWRDCRGKINSLKFQAFVLLGMEDYDSHLKPYMERKGGNDLNRLREVEPAVLMRYCGMDSLLEVLVAQQQMNGVKWPCNQ